MFGSFLPSQWFSTNHSLLGSKEPTLLCNQVTYWNFTFPVIRAGSNGRCNTIWYKAVFKGGVYETRETVWVFGRAIRCLVSRHGGIAPAVRRRALLALTLREREEISHGLASGSSIREIAQRLERAVSTVSREVARHGGRPA
jgi:DNA-binding CsgD family transcriptional regulator